MELRSLRYFLAVAREENITKAAESLHITQPTLSRQLMQLEEQLGEKLFHRGQRKIVLTEAGLLFRRRAEEILLLVSKTENEFHEQNLLINGEISIGAGESAGVIVLSKILKQFNNRYPEATFDLYTGNADQVNERIDNGLIDIALLLEPVNLENYEYIRLPGAEVWGIVLPSNDPLAKKPYVEVDDLVSRPLINTKRKNMQNELDNWFGSKAKKMHFTGSSNLIGNATIMVKDGLGYAFCIEGSLSSYNDEATCFRPLYPSLTTTSVIVWKKNQIFSPTVTKFLEELTMLVKHDE